LIAEAVRRRVEGAAGAARSVQRPPTGATELDATGVVRVAPGTRHAGASQRAGPGPVGQVAGA